RAAQRLVDEYSGAGGNVIELPSTGDSSAEVIAQLRLPEEILMMARVGVSMSEPDHIDVGLGRSRVLFQVDSLLRMTGREHLDLVIPEVFVAGVERAATAPALETL